MHCSNRGVEKKLALAAENENEDQKEDDEDQADDQIPPARADDDVDSIFDPVEDSDYWSYLGGVLQTSPYHFHPRENLFVPTDEDCPLPVEYLDVIRRTSQT